QNHRRALGPAAQFLTQLLPIRMKKPLTPQDLSRGATSRGDGKVPMDVHTNLRYLALYSHGCLLVGYPTPDIVTSGRETAFHGITLLPPPLLPSAPSSSVAVQRGSQR